MKRQHQAYQGHDWMACLAYISVVSLVTLFVSACSIGERTHLLYEGVLNTSEHKALVSNPKSLNGTYYEIKARRDVVGSISFDEAIEAQDADQMSKEAFLAKYSQSGNFDDFKAKNVLLNEGTNEENAKANLLLEVIDGQSRGPRATAVQVRVLNKKYAGQKLWIGSQDFLVQARKIPCPISDPSVLEFNEKPKEHLKPSSKAKHRK